MTILNTQAAMDVALLVDQYRHQHQAMEKYLNQHESRAELEKALTEFYQRQGITDVSPEMIKAGIEAYEKNRFTFKGVQGSWMAQKAASLYLWAFSNRWYINVTAVSAIALVIALVVGINWLDASMNASRLAGLREQVQQFVDQNSPKPAQALQYAEQVARDLDALSIERMVHARDQARTSAKHIEHQLEALRAAALEAQTSSGKEVFLIDPSADSEEAIEAEQLRWQQYVNIQKPVLDGIDQKIGAIKPVLAGLQKLVDADFIFQATEQLDLYKKYKKDADVLTERTGILLSLRAGNGEAALTALNNLNDTLLIKDVSKSLLAMLDEVAPSLSEGFKDQEGEKRVAALIQAARGAAVSGKTKEFHATLERIQSLKAYVNAELRIRIVDRPGVESGFARNNDRTKRYYVVLEAIDSNGRVFQRDIENVETGAIEKVSRWGERVERHVFELVKGDKVADGVVDDVAFGNKPAGFYEINYSKSTLGSSVTRW